MVDIFSCLKGLQYTPKPKRALINTLDESDSKKQKFSVPAVRNSRIHSTYEIPLSELPAGWETSEWMTQFTVQPAEAKGFRKEPSPPFHVYEMTEEKLLLPRFRGTELFGPAETDARSSGEGMMVGSSFNGSLRENQVNPCTLVVNSLLKSGGATLVLPCGQGKTVSSIYIAMHPEIMRRTLVLVAKKRLMDQWIQEIPKFSTSTAPIGAIQGDRFETDGCDFVVGTIQTILSKERGFVESHFDQFGTVIVDEAHHIAARSFSRVMRLMGAKHVMALSATPDRQDGLGFLIHWLLGPVACDRRRKVGDDKVEVEMITYTRGKEEEITYKDGRIGHASMINNLAKDETRTDLIVERLEKLFAPNMPRRNVLVLTGRRKHAESMMYGFFQKAPNVETGIMLGGMRQENLDAAQRMPVIFSTYTMWSEGIDEPRLDTLILATPMSNIEQSVGRILRKNPNKCRPLIIDIVDPFSIFQNQAWKRKAFYKKLGYWINRTTDVEKIETYEAPIDNIFQLPESTNSMK